MTAQEIMTLIQEQDIKMVDFKIVDIDGQFRHVTIPAANFTEETLKNASALTRRTTVTPSLKRATWFTSPIWTPR